MKREGAAIKIQKNLRRHLARKNYAKLMSCAIVLQIGLRAMAAHDEFRYRRETKAGIIIQVVIHLFLLLEGSWLLSIIFSKSKLT